MTEFASPHVPILVPEVLACLDLKPGGIYCDATVGYGGHARAILARIQPGGRLIGLDRDADALAFTRMSLAEFGADVTLVHAPFSRLAEVLASLGVNGLDGCMADLGVSSAQLDQGERGFSFRRSGPLDMRMDRSQGESVADLLGRAEEEELSAILRDLGEERYARRIARTIVETRTHTPLNTTDALADLVARCVPSRERRKDPATRTFQALRIAVNRELEELDRFLTQAPGCLKQGGRLAIISFHSLEDRMVKHRFRALAGQGPGQPHGKEQGLPPVLRILTKKPINPSDEEIARNPRARSAHLRAAEKRSPKASEIEAPT